MTGWSCDGKSGMLASATAVRRAAVSFVKGFSACDACAHVCVPEIWERLCAHRQHMQHSEEAKSSLMQAR